MQTSTLTQIAPDGKKTTYQGEFDDGLKHGRGDETEPNGDTFEYIRGAIKNHRLSPIPNFHKGKRHGVGIFTRHANGTKTKRFYDNGKLKTEFELDK